MSYQWTKLIKQARYIYIVITEDINEIGIPDASWY